MPVGVLNCVLVGVANWAGVDVPNCACDVVGTVVEIAAVSLVGYLKGKEAYVRGA